MRRVGVADGEDADGRQAADVKVGPRPTVSLIVPFHDSDDELDRLVAALAEVERRPGDEVIVADNRSAGDRWPPAAGVRFVGAAGVRTASYARNRGAEAAGGEWLAFIDADTRPVTGLLDLYFQPPPRARTAVLAGGIIDVSCGFGVVSRHGAEREGMSHLRTLTRDGRPYAQTANCAVRRSAFTGVGGFNEQIRAGEDADLCFRLADAGWELEPRARAAVEHASRSTLRRRLGQLVNHGSGAAWLNRRYPDEFPPPRPRELGGRLAHDARELAAGLARGRRDQAAYAILDLLETCAFDLGRLRSNRARSTRGSW